MRTARGTTQCVSLSSSGAAPFAFGLHVLLPWLLHQIVWNGSFPSWYRLSTSWWICSLNYHLESLLRFWLMPQVWEVWIWNYKLVNIPSSLYVGQQSLWLTVLCLSVFLVCTLDQTVNSRREGMGPFYIWIFIHTNKFIHPISEYLLNKWHNSVSMPKNLCQTSFPQMFFSF